MNPNFTINTTCPHCKEAFITALEIQAATVQPEVKTVEVLPEPVKVAQKKAPRKTVKKS